MHESSWDSDPPGESGRTDERVEAGAKSDDTEINRSTKRSTGIPALDRKLDGGLPLGTIAVLTAAPASQSELLLFEFVNGAQSLYLTTGRSASSVRSALRESGTDADRLDVRRVDDRSPLVDARVALEEHSESTTLVIDQMGLLEREPEPEYRAFLDSLEEWTERTESVAILHCLEGRGVADRRDLTEHLADVIFALNTDLSGDRVVYSLAVPKFRVGQGFEDVIKLDLSGDVDIDLSRKIS